MTYRNLTIEFLNSFDFEPYVVRDSCVIFILFGTQYSFTQKEFGDLLGFQTTSDAILELPMGYFMSRDIEKFWSDITGGGGSYPSTQLSHIIHNPTLRYL